VSLQPDQFFEYGFAERKLILVLDLFDLINRAKKDLKIEKTLNARGTGPYASDRANHAYTVVNHVQKKANEYDFKINATSLETKIKCKKTTLIPSELNREAQFDIKTYAKMMDHSAQKLEKSYKTEDNSYVDKSRVTELMGVYTLERPEERK